MKTKVVNIRNDEYDIKICRHPKNGVTKAPEQGCFGNPFYLADVNNDEERAKVIEKYREYFYKRIEEEKDFLDAVLSLKGKRLACFCSPKPCHGDVIVDFLEGD